MHTSPSNKRYIGVTSRSPNERWRNGHGYKNNVHFTRAIEKYGWDNFKHEILATKLTEEEAYKMEVELIEKYNTFNSNNGYNLTSGGETCKQHTDETRAKQSELAKKLWQDEEYRKAHSEYAKTLVGEKNPNYGNHKLAGENNPNYGKKHTNEIREKIRIKALNMSDETRKKMSEAAKRNMTPEKRERLRELAKMRRPNDETREKMSQSQKERWDEESRLEWSKKVSGDGNPMYGKHHSEETKQLLREMFSGENSVWYGRHHTEESKQKAHDSCTWKVPVVKLTLQGDFIEEFDSYSNAAKSVDGRASAIITCCNGEAKSAYGFLWIKKESYNEKNISIYKNAKHRPVVQLGMDWIYLNKYQNLAEAGRAINAPSTNIGRSCKSKGVYTSKGFRWMYEEDYLEIEQKGEK